MQRTLALVLAFHGLAGALRAQGEAALRSHFEGRTVVVKVAMPAAEAGIDVTPGTSQPIGAPTHRAERREGTLSVQARTYDAASGRVVAELVEGVLVRFTIMSR